MGQTNSDLNPIINSIDRLKTLRFVEIDEIEPRTFLPTDMSKYYRYEGSLTTPPCTENVIWTVMDETLTIGQSQVSTNMHFFCNIS